MFTAIIVVFSFKSMCLPGFIFISCCVSELRGHLCPHIVMYGLRLFIVVLQGLPNCLHVCMIKVRCCYHFTKFRCLTLSEIAKCIA